MSVSRSDHLVRACDKKTVNMLCITPRSPKSPFQVLDNDCLDLVAIRVLDDLFEKPCATLRDFEALKCATRWNPSEGVHRHVLRAFALPTTQHDHVDDMHDNVEKIISWFATYVDRLERVGRQRNTPRNLGFYVDAIKGAAGAVACLYNMLRELETFVSPLLTLPRTLDEWNHAYLVFSQCTGFDHTPYWCGSKFGNQARMASNLCRVILNDADGSLLKRNQEIMRSVIKATSLTALDDLLTNNRFLHSRSNVTPFRLWIRLWCDHEDQPSPRLELLLKHDPSFLEAHDASGSPSCHGLLVSGVACKRTFDFLATKNAFNGQRRTLLEGNTALHSLWRMPIKASRLVRLAQPLIYIENKQYMMNRLCRLFTIDEILHTRNKNGEYADTLLQGLIEAVDESGRESCLSPEIKLVAVKTADRLRSAQKVLRRGL